MDCDCCPYRGVDYILPHTIKIVLKKGQDVCALRGNFLSVELRLETRWILKSIIYLVFKLLSYIELNSAMRKEVNHLQEMFILTKIDM